MKEKKIFRKGSILEESCDQFSFRIDFYSKPNFFETFLKLWDEMMTECELGQIKFHVNRLNIVQQNMVNVDAVAESLNTTIDGILDTPTYIFPSLFSKDGSDHSPDQKFIMFLNPYFIDIFVKNLSIDNFIVRVCNMLYRVAFILWKKNVISVSDMYLNLGTREIISKDVYLSRDGFGGYNPINNKGLHNQFSTYQFIEDNIRCIVKNFLSLVNVDIKGENMQMWEHVISSDCIYSLVGNEDDESFMKMFNRMTESCQKYIDCVCVK
ncbi:MAG: hypothetical protein HDS59_00555 [Barnesiella sp.]|nr:hypothetical protein [Barnesiella sp.]